MKRDRRHMVSEGAGERCTQTPAPPIQSQRGQGQGGMLGGEERISATQEESYLKYSHFGTSHDFNAPAVRHIDMVTELQFTKPESPRRGGVFSYWSSHAMCS